MRTLRFAALLLVATLGRADEFDDADPDQAPEPSLSEQLERFQKISQEAAATDDAIFVPPSEASEWYEVTIANVSVGYMHTTVWGEEDGSRISTTEIMDVQVSRGTDTSHMAFETVFHEDPYGKDPLELSERAALNGGVQIMAYDQRFANSDVKMNASFMGEGISLTSNNGEQSHVSELELPDEAWMGRMRARLEFTRQCREGKSEIIVKTMRPELGPKVAATPPTLAQRDPGAGMSAPIRHGASSAV
eukprot:2694890-Prymnesium_polylepis.3